MPVHQGLRLRGETEDGQRSAILLEGIIVLAEAFWEFGQNLLPRAMPEF
jgi:hypothetical protein